MPMFDVSCPKCDWEAEDVFTHKDLPACPQCGSATNKVWRTAPTVIDDTIIGGETIENLAPNPITFYSRSEKRDYLRAHGIHQKVRHVGTPGEGSDKSPHTSRWI